jgi:hypothetical protein
MIKAIKAGNYVTWPELTAKVVHKHFPESDETQKGQIRLINLKGTLFVLAEKKTPTGQTALQKKGLFE